MGKYSIEEINSIAKDMKYEALYWALGFEELEKNSFSKNSIFRVDKDAAFCYNGSAARNRQGVLCPTKDLYGACTGETYYKR